VHSYSVDNGKKIKSTVPVLLVILTSLLYSLFQSIGVIDILQSFENSISWLSPLIDWGFISVVITPITIFGVFYFLFNKYIWKWKIVNKFLGVPNVNGKYEGLLQSTYLNESTGIRVEPIQMILEVNQTFDSIKFTSFFPNTPSSSSSNMGGLISVEDGTAEFVFAYSNKSRDISIENDRHDGMNILRFNLGDGSVEGEYFNNRGKKPNKGTMDLEKI
jgi:hypothetical protein